MINTIKLINETPARDTFGNDISRETAREVICEISSIGQAEYFKAREHKLQAQHRANISPFDYEGEKLAELDGVRFKIYRTFLKGDFLELYLAEN